MTTIAFDGKLIASDSQLTGDYIDPIKGQKIKKINGSIIGMSGNCAQWQLFIRWYRDQTKPKPDPKHLDDFHALIIKEGKVYECTELCELVEIGVPAACGSGGMFAVAAMLAGADARKAVEIAMKLDPYTGGKIKTVKIK